MPQNKIIQPLNKPDQEKTSLINVVRGTQRGDQSVPNVPSPDELDRADMLAQQKANQLIAQENLKNIGRYGNSGDTPYVHNSTNGFDLNPLWLFSDPRSSKIGMVLAGVLTATVIVLALLFT